MSPKIFILALACAAASISVAEAVNATTCGTSCDLAGMQSVWARNVESCRSAISVYAAAAWTLPCLASASKVMEDQLIYSIWGCRTSVDINIILSVFDAICGCIVKIFTILVSCYSGNMAFPAGLAALIALQVECNLGLIASVSIYITLLGVVNLCITLMLQVMLNAAISVFALLV